ncbi:MAG: glutaredoxin family protein [Thermomicrobiales bacterium]
MIPTQKSILYTQQTCPESPKVRAWLVKHHIPFTERDVTTDIDAAKALYETGIFATPLLVVGETKVLGFRVEELADALRSICCDDCD